jgi:hypothetical protein
MSNLVYTFRCRLSPEAEQVAWAEITRQRDLYNSMVGQYNPHPRQRALSIIARHRLAQEECYTGSYFSAVAAFQAATSAKRVGKWPWEPYRFRSRHELRGSKVGAVWMLHSAPTWERVLSGCTSLLTCSSGPKMRRNYSEFSLRVSRNDPPIRFTANVRRQIPLDAKIVSAYLVPDGDKGERHWWDLQITFAPPEITKCSAPPDNRVGIDLGWQLCDDGSMLVAVTSDGKKLSIPPYAIRMAQSIEAVQAQRDVWTQFILDELRKREEPCLAKSAYSVIEWIEFRGIHGMQMWIDKARELRRRQQHLRRRFAGIRDELYRDFASTHRGAYVLKMNLKQPAEGELKGTELNHERTWASLFSLALCLRERGAIEVTCERSSDSTVPSLGNADQIRQAGESGSVLIRAARKPHHKFRKRLVTSVSPQNAITTAR